LICLLKNVSTYWKHYDSYLACNWLHII
jgi:hypothetical protein